MPTVANLMPVMDEMTKEIAKTPLNCYKGEHPQFSTLTNLFYNGMYDVRSGQQWLSTLIILIF